MTPDVAVPRDDSAEVVYHSLSADSCDTEKYILVSVETAHHERELEPCGDCNPPEPNRTDESTTESDASTQQQGTTSEKSADETKQDPSDEGTEPQWGASNTSNDDSNDDATAASPGTDSDSKEEQQSLITDVPESESLTNSSNSSGENSSETVPSSKEDQQQTTPDMGTNDKTNSQEEMLEGEGDIIDREGDVALEESLVRETEEDLSMTPEGQQNGDNPHLSDRVSPREAAQSNDGILDMPNRTQDLPKFEFVMGEDDDVGLENVSQEGMVVLGESKYAAIARVRPRAWSVLKDGDKQQIINSYKSAFLSPLDSPIQIVEYPSQFDISDHLAMIEETRREAEGDPSTNPLIQAGRRVYPRWLDGFIKRNGMKQRKFFLIVTISEDQVEQFGEGDGGMVANLRNQSDLLDSAIARIKREKTDGTESRKKCLRELNTRMGRIQSGLQRFNVDAERLDDRDEVLKVLYEYYNDSNPRMDSFETDQITTAAPGSME